MIMAITVVGIKINHQILTLSLLAPSGAFFILSNAQQISTIFDIQNQTYIVLFRYMILRVKNEVTTRDQIFNFGVSSCQRR